MLNRRHHIHLICDNRDSSLYPIQDSLAIFFETKALLTYDLYEANTDTANYSWRCVNACDCAIVLVGESYGALTNTGVSQLHISYLNAKTKNKPVVAFIYQADGKPRKLSEFETLIRSQLSMVYLFDDDTDIKALIEQAYQKLPLIQADLPDPSDDSVSQKLSQSDKTPDILIEKTADKTPKIDNLPTQANDDIDDIFDKIPKLATAYEHNFSGVTSFLNPNLQDDVMLSCTAHAFQGGTLIEVAFMASTKWQAVLSKLVSMPVFSSRTLWRVLNELVTPQAMPAICLTHPSVHAISRCQVTKADMLWVQEELVGAGWLINNSASTGKENWQVTELAKTALNAH